MSKRERWEGPSSSSQSILLLKPGAAQFPSLGHIFARRCTLFPSHVHEFSSHVLATNPYDPKSSVMHLQNSFRIPSQFCKVTVFHFPSDSLVAWALICAKVSFGHILNVVRSELWGNPAGIFQTIHPRRCLELDPSAHCFSWGCVDKAPCVCIRLVLPKRDNDGRPRTWEPSERSRRALFPTIHRLGGSDESEVRCPEPLPTAHLLIPLNISEHFWTFSKMLNCIWKSKTKCKNKDKGVLSRFLPPIYSLPPLLLSQLWNFSQNGKKDKSGTRASSSPISYHAMVVPWVAHFTKYLETFELVLSDLTKHSFRCDKSVLWGILRYFLGLWSFSRYSELLLDIS